MNTQTVGDDKPKKLFLIETTDEKLFVIADTIELALKSVDSPIESLTVIADTLLSKKRVIGKRQRLIA
ncbi:MAG TPA: hypothetical protein VF411_02065 [Bacteroidia bacterium]